MDPASGRSGPTQVRERPVRRDQVPTTCHLFARPTWAWIPGTDQSSRRCDLERGRTPVGQPDEAMYLDACEDRLSDSDMLDEAGATSSVPAVPLRTRRSDKGSEAWNRAAERLRSLTSAAALHHQLSCLSGAGNAAPSLSGKPFGPAASRPGDGKSDVSPCGHRAPPTAAPQLTSFPLAARDAASQPFKPTRKGRSTFDFLGGLPASGRARSSRAPDAQGVSFDRVLAPRCARIWRGCCSTDHGQPGR